MTNKATVAPILSNTKVGDKFYTKGKDPMQIIAMISHPDYGQCIVASRMNAYKAPQIYTYNDAGDCIGVWRDGQNEEDWRAVRRSVTSYINILEDGNQPGNYFASHCMTSSEEAVKNSESHSAVGNKLIDTIIINA